ncbi:exodeoxyribonuclease III [Campylobacter sp. RM12327]|uniref:exodeoxyribonuclease III n=1 Tax=Campylobacter sputorum TaxID=206 RepID=UPI000B783105|nr:MULTISPECIES: exodeoxyribonuclease III [Campylobacter]ASM39627.1 exodeoxyribonuclease III (exonuclease III) [Campylobacter sputorum]MBE7358329.1 exodeoxyribonuclease III [Campylobacter sp. RM11302]MBF6669491.1 exodeoxyribonuclease III [Campylobacter sp. RM12327]MBF6674766.1 exodeoxyribonuclease III [Campylobacter sp. RM13538]MBF6676401.1 exodeoxyribonuclease III [Campylobacter sp. RM12321]
MKLISWNTNGLRATIKNNGFEWLKEYNPDFLALQETKVKDSDIPKEIYNLGFNQIDTNAASRAGYSGVMSLSKFENICFKSNFNNDDEGRVLEHNFDDIVLFNIYFPNGQKDEERLKYKLDFYDKFLDYANNLVKNGKKVIFCGDVNTAHREIDLKNPKANAQTSGFLDIERKWIDKVLECGYIDTFRQINRDEIKYSWWSYRFNARKNNAGWRIDYFFISQNLKNVLKDAFILNDVFGSDHCPVGIEIDI